MGNEKSVPFIWSKLKLEAARLLAEDEISDQKLAEALNISRSSITKWKTFPEFQEKMKQFLRAWEERIMNTGIANKARRVEALARMHQRHEQIIFERAETANVRRVQVATEEGIEFSCVDKPGLSTGLIVERDKVAGFYDGNPIFRTELEFDAGFHREYRATLAQVAEEAGQTVRKHEVTGADGGPVALSVNVIDDVSERIRMAKARRDMGTPPAVLAAEKITNEAMGTLVELAREEEARLVQPSEEDILDKLIAGVDDGPQE